MEGFLNLNQMTNPSGIQNQLDRIRCLAQYLSQCKISKIIDSVRVLDFEVSGPRSNLKSRFSSYPRYYLTVAKFEPLWPGISLTYGPCTIKEPGEFSPRNFWEISVLFNGTTVSLDQFLSGGVYQDFYNTYFLSTQWKVQLTQITDFSGVITGFTSVHFEVWTQLWYQRCYLAFKPFLGSINWSLEWNLLRVKFLRVWLPSLRGRAECLFPGFKSFSYFSVSLNEAVVLSSNQDREVNLSKTDPQLWFSTPFAPKSRVWSEN